jgi:tetratricopeptide (TPR) repeat protein
MKKIFLSLMAIPVLHFAVSAQTKGFKPLFDGKTTTGWHTYLKTGSGAWKVVDGALQNLGAVQNDLGDFAGAVKSLTPVVERHPDWLFSQYALGSALFLTGNYNDAAKWFNAVLVKQPDFVPALSSLGNTQLRLKNGKELKRVIDLLKPLAPTEASKLEIEARVAKVKIG